MAVNPRNSSKAKSKGAKKPAAKATKKPAPKSVVKPIAQPAAKKPVQAEKQSSAGIAFDKKIDQMAKKGTTEQKTGGGNSSSKAVIGIVIIIVIAAAVYFLYPKGKTSIVKEDPASKAVPQTPAEVKAPEPPKEPVQKEVVKPKPGETVYTVKQKDQLTEISKKYYGNFIGWKRIYAANKDKIKDPRLIFPGQELIIPKAEK